MNFSKMLLWLSITIVAETNELIHALRLQNLSKPEENQTHPSPGFLHSVSQSLPSIMVALYREKTGGSSATMQPTGSNHYWNFSNKEKKAATRSNTIFSLNCQESEERLSDLFLRFEPKKFSSFNGRITYAEIVVSDLNTMQNIRNLRLQIDGVSQDIEVPRKRSKKSKRMVFDVTRLMRITSFRDSDRFKSVIQHINKMSCHASLIIFSRDEKEMKIPGESLPRPERSRRYSRHHKSQRLKGLLNVSSRKRNENFSYNNLNSCRRVIFFVDFGKIGWNEWIVYPRRYLAHRCEGSCNVVSMTGNSPTNHAYAQSFYSSGHPQHGITESCCVPTKLKPLRLLYFEGKQIVQREHKDMIVEECGCR